MRKQEKYWLWHEDISRQTQTTAVCGNQASNSEDTSGRLCTENEKQSQNNSTGKKYISWVSRQAKESKVEVHLVYHSKMSNI